ncbi:MAG: WYL domain-containing protein [Lachnospiraceae bacterium]|nr:WYL domain-containing protein [Lachnospiraceae bacterium]
MAEVQKKLVILYVLEILKKYTDEDHTLTQKEISDLLKSNYDIKVDRKTMKKYLEGLVDSDLDISYREIARASSDDDEENIQWTDFSLTHDFTDAELKLLIDGILFSRNIPVSQRRALIEKLEGLSSRYFKTGARNILTVQGDEGASKELFYNIEMIDEAINQNKRIDFNYLEYHTDKKLHKRITKNNKIRRFTVSPYRIAATNNRYYVICNNDWFGKGLSHFRIDRITNIKILDEPRVPENEIEGYDHGFSLAKHMSEHVFMFSDKAERVKFRMKKTLLSELFDWFEPDMTFTDETEDEVTVSLMSSLQAMRLWGTQFAREVTVLSPENLVDQIRQDLKEAYEKYQI